MIGLSNLVVDDVSGQGVPRHMKERLLARIESSPQTGRRSLSKLQLVAGLLAAALILLGAWHASELKVVRDKMTSLKSLLK